MAGELKSIMNPWIRPWNIEKFDDLFNRDERYFAVLLKGVLAWFNENIIMYNKPIKHFIFTTGSSYMYIESNGYDFKWNETTGEDWMYMELPRCVIEMNSLRVPTEELSSPYARGTYERQNGNAIQSFNAQIRRLPIELDLTFRYYFSNFNEYIVFLQEALDKLLFQKFFRIAYLGESIRCSIEMPQDFNVQINPIDMTSTDPRQRTIELSIKINSNYPLVDEKTEIPVDRVIKYFSTGINFFQWTAQHPIFVYDKDGNKIEVHYTYDEDDNNDSHDINDEQHSGVLVDSEGNVVDQAYDEFGDPIPESELNQMFNYKIPEHSTLFAGDISNTTDIISREKILK